MGQRILTSHVGSLPRPERLLALYAQQEQGGEVDDGGFGEELHTAVAAVVARQREAGIDLVNDGEYGHAMGTDYDYGSWWTYVFPRLAGLELAPRVAAGAHTQGEGELVLGGFYNRRDRTRFADAYDDPSSGVSLPVHQWERPFPVCRGPISYRGGELVARDIANMKAALQAAGLDDGFLNAVAPASCARFANEHYASDEELLFACAEAMREEYTAIIDAGLMLQLDDPAIAEEWDQFVPEPSLEEYRRFTMTRIEALNHAIRGLPPERIRFHLCWGSWHGPHTTDIPMKDLVEIMLSVNAGFYSFEAANARHEHEWEVWREVKLPEGKKILPGIVTHSTNVVEHPELVAQRIVRFAQQVGPENVIASTDCGLGGRIHPQIAWAKLEALSEGAALAGARL